MDLRHTDGSGRPVGCTRGIRRGCGPDPLRRAQEVIDALTGDEPPMTVLVCVDDAHLLDDQSAYVLSQLVERRIAPVLMTVRDGEILPEAMAWLYAGGRLPHIEVPALDSSDVTALLELVLDGPLESSSAQRFWSFTRGNALYLRQLITDELAAGRLSHHFGVWIWDGAPSLSLSLVELIGSGIGRLDESVLDVLDVLAVCDPVELPVLHSFAGPAAVEAATARGFVAVDSAAGVVRLAHPLYGEVRREQAGTGLLRTLRGRLADMVGALPAQSPVQLVRRGVLMLDADGYRDPELLRTASVATRPRTGR